MIPISPPQNAINDAIALYSNGQIQAALDTTENLIKAYPNDSLLFNISGICYKTIGKLNEAVKSFEKALVIQPTYAEVHYNLAVTYQELIQLDAAINSYKTALKIKPDYADACNNLGVIFNKLNQNDDAVKILKKALTIKPDFADASNNLGIAFKKLGQVDDAIKSYEKAIAIKPDYAQAHNNLGNALKNLGKLDLAVKSYKKAFSIKPNYAEAHNNLGITLTQLNQLVSAIESHEKALAIKPDYAEAYYNRGNALTGLKRLDEALISYEHAITLKPEIDFILGDLLHTQMDLCIWDELPRRLNELKNKINNNEKVIHPFNLLALIDDPQIQKNAAEIFVNKRYPKSNLLSKIDTYPKHKKIRIGYFSSDFRNHPVSHLTAEIYEIHNRNKFEIYGFYFGPVTQDKMNLRIKAGVDYFHDVRTLSNKDVANLARTIKLDIAVDLGGFTQYSRTDIFALSLAPIQISYIGYLGTMGVNYYDYLMADPTIIPKKNQKYYSEKIAYLPNYQANDSTQSVPTTTFTRKDIGLPDLGFVFCCFNNTYKITPTTFDSWGRILEGVDGSVLLIYVSNESAKINLTKEIILRGIDPSRLIFGEKLPKPEYLARYRVANLFLDTHPYNAGTVASDALRMGLPVLTCIGKSFASRMASSVLNTINLPELITASPEEYESLAIELATNPEKLKTIKDKLDSNLLSAQLYNTSLFTRHLESAYSTMYDRYQKGLEPDHIYVEQ